MNETKSLFERVMHTHIHDWRKHGPFSGYADEDAYLARKFVELNPIERLQAISDAVDEMFEERAAPPSVIPKDVLTSADGSFSCVPALAVEEAYIMNLCGSIAEKEAFAAPELGEVIFQYVAGSSTAADTIADLQQWLKELDK